MDVHCADIVTDQERALVDTWVHMRDVDDVGRVVIGTRVVAVHINVRGVGLTGASERHGDLEAELNEALGMLRQLRDL